MTVLLLLCLSASASPYGKAKRTCAKLSPTTCAEEATALVEAEDPRGLPLLEGACVAGALTGCRTLADWSLKGNGPSVRPPVALQSLELLCADGRADACSDLGWVLHHGVLGEPDPGRAAVLYGSACERGVREACAGLDVLGQSAVEASDSVAMACARGDGDACVQLSASMLLDGRGAELEAPLRSACEIDLGLACGILGNLVVVSRESAEERIEGISLLEKACDLRVAKSCVSAADAWSRGLAGRADTERAARLLHQACDFGHEEACENHDH